MTTTVGLPGQQHARSARLSDARQSTRFLAWTLLALPGGVPVGSRGDARTWGGSLSASAPRSPGSCGTRHRLPAGVSCRSLGQVLDQRVSRREEHALTAIRPAHQVRRRSVLPLDGEDHASAAMVIDVTPPDHQFITHVRAHRQPPLPWLHDHLRAARSRAPGPKVRRPAPISPADRRDIRPWLVPDAVSGTLRAQPGLAGRLADAPEVPPGHCPARLTQLMSTVSSARPGGYPGRADRRQG